MPDFGSCNTVVTWSFLHACLVRAGKTFPYGQEFESGLVILAQDTYFLWDQSRSASAVTDTIQSYPTSPNVEP